MQQAVRPKICLVGECLSTGGAEKAMALLSEYFCSQGIDVHIVTVLDSISYNYSGTLLNLGKLKNSSNGPWNKYKRFKKLYSYLRKHRFDYIIDFRVRVSFIQEFLISRILYNAPTVYTVHSSMNWLYFPGSARQSRLLYKKSYGLVAVSGAIKDQIEKDFKLDAKIIFNPIDLKRIERSAEQIIGAESEYILAAGRMKDDIKQFGRLIETYAATNLAARGIKLVILGDGPDKAVLEQIIRKLDLTKMVLLKGFVENPYPYMKNALCFVLSSKREGLPTVLIESLACGTPVISFDCKTGPNEIVINDNNGVLIKDQDFESLRSELERIVSDTALLEQYRLAAKDSVSHFSVDIIGRRWLEFLKINVSSPYEH